jgi:uncharacterized protein (DUF983 family)
VTEVTKAAKVTKATEIDMSDSTSPANPSRDVWTALRQGLLGRCPACNKRGIFRVFLKVSDQCPHCQEPLHHHRADDAPAYFVILIVGHIIVPIALLIETHYAPPMWLHFIVWIPATLGLSLALLQPIKGAIVNLQWAFRMHGFAAHEPDGEVVPAASPRPERHP